MGLAPFTSPSPLRRGGGVHNEVGSVGVRGCELFITGLSNFLPVWIVAMIDCGGDGCMSGSKGAPGSDLAPTPLPPFQTARSTHIGQFQISAQNLGRQMCRHSFWVYGQG